MGERSGLQVGHSSTRTLLLQSHAVVTHAECGLSRDVPEKDVTWMAAYVAPKPVCTVQHVCAFTDVQVTNAMGTNTPHTITDAGF